MNPVDRCPDPSRLRDHLEGTLPGAVEAAMVAHLDACASCRSTLEGLGAGQDGLAELARAIGRDGPTDGLTGPGHPDIFHDAPPIPPDDTSALEILEPPGHPGHLGRLGPYAILDVRNRGGMGVVFRAIDPDLGRVVAIKVMAPQLAASTSARLRFVREGRAAAAVRDDHVVAIHAVGESRGLPYLVMEFVEGQSLQERLDADGCLPIGEVLRIGVQAAAGLAAVHARGLVHRDVKPANILLDRGTGRVKVTDFGLARTLDDDRLTQTGVAAGTPRFMAPEQAQGQVADHRADLFSLGGVLYAMATGRPPFADGPPLAVLKRICEEAPPPPRRLNPAVPLDLETVILKAMAKDPADRYATAADLAEDLHRVGDDRPIQARRTTVVQRVRRWARRHPVLVRVGLGVAAGVLVLAVVGLVVSNALIRREQQETAGALAAAEEHRRRAEGLAATLNAHLTRLRIERGAELVAAGDASAALPWFADAFLHQGDDASRAPAHRDRLAATLAQVPRLEGMAFHDGPLTAADLGRDGRLLLTASHDGTARLWHVATGEPAGPPLRHGDPIHFAVLDPDGRRAVTGSEPTVEAKLWEAASGRLVAALAHGGTIFSAAFSPDGTRLVTASADGTARVWDAATGQPVTAPLRFSTSVRVAVFSPDGRRVLATSSEYTPPGTHRGEARVWDATTGEPITPLLSPGTTIPDGCFSPNGRRVLLANQNGAASVWDADTGKRILVLTGSRVIRYVAFSPDGRLALTGNQLGSARVWDAATGEPAGPEVQHPAALTGIGFAPDGRRFLTAGKDGRVFVWDAATGRLAAPPLYHGAEVAQATFAPDGDSIVTASHDGAARVWRLRSLPLAFHRAIPGNGNGPGLDFSPNSRRLLAAGEDMPVSVWNLANGTEVHWPAGPGLVRAAFDPPADAS